MDERDPKRPTPVGAKRAFLDNLDAILGAQGLPVRAPSPVPKAPPPPALTFEAWAALSARFAAAPPEDLGAALAAHGVTLEVWKRFDEAYRRTLSDDVRAGQRERPAVYEARYQEERARQAGHAGAPSEVTPPAAPAPERAPAHLRGTNGAPDLPAAMMAAMGRMPFVPPPPAPAPAPPGKRAPKTVESKARAKPVGGQTMDLDAALQRPTPNLPFAGAPGDAGAIYVPSLSARQYVALRAELKLKAAPREETRRRYHVPNEAALRALHEHWQHPARRAELETALADFALVLRGEVLG
jgi:hypothetical protein